MGCFGNQLILHGMLWLKFLLFLESSEVRKDVPVNGRGGVWTVEGKHKGYRGVDKTKVRHLRQK